jgi:hypothetical protein
VVKKHPKSMNAFVFIFNEPETQILDFYMTTENGIVTGGGGGGGGHASISDRLTRTCKDDINSFVDDFKLCS